MNSIAEVVHFRYGNISISFSPLSFANDVANKDDADADPTNELQSLSLNGDTLNLSERTVLLNIGDQQLSKIDSVILLTNGGQVILNDDDPNNEIQSLSIVGSQLTISGFNTVTLPSGGSSSLWIWHMTYRIRRGVISQSMQTK